MNWSGNADFIVGDCCDQSSGALSRFTVHVDIHARHHAICQTRSGGGDHLQLSGSDISSPAIFLLPGGSGGGFRSSIKLPSRPSRTRPELSGDPPTSTVIRTLPPIMFSRHMRFRLSFRSRGMLISKLVKWQMVRLGERDHQGHNYGSIYGIRFSCRRNYNYGGVSSRPR